MARVALLVSVVASKHHAAPQLRVPAESTTANNRCRCYDNRCCGCYDNRRSGRYDNRCRGRYDNRRHGRDYDRAIGAASSVGSSVKARATAAFRAGAVEEDE